MNITYLIGNGFDIGLGLKTRYSDFLKQYVSRAHVQVEAARWLVEQIRNAPQNTWANAESAFGKLPFSDSGLEIGRTIRESLFDFQTELARYLAREEEHLVIPSEEQDAVQTRFLRSIVRMLLQLPDTAAEHELYELSAPRVVVRINIISFNYTESIFKLLGGLSFPRGVVKIRLDEKYQIDAIINSICYVHGSLKERNSIFGVDESYQIDDEMARRHCEHDGLMLKSEIDRLLCLGYEDRARQMIEKSDRIVCFGMSYGETDLRWWDCIYLALTQNEKTRLMLVPYFDENRECESGSQQLLLATEVRDSFLASIRAANDDPVMEDLPGINRVIPRIVVAKHYPHFDFDHNVNYCDPLNLKWFGHKYVKRDVADT